MVATASRDQLVKVFDIRAMKEFVTLRGHKKEVCCEFSLALGSLVLLPYLTDSPAWTSNA